MKIQFSLFALLFAYSLVSLTASATENPAAACDRPISQTSSAFGSGPQAPLQISNGEFEVHPSSTQTLSSSTRPSGQLTVLTTNGFDHREIRTTVARNGLDYEISSNSDDPTVFVTSTFRLENEQCQPIQRIETGSDLVHRVRFDRVLCGQFRTAQLASAGLEATYRACDSYFEQLDQIYEKRRLEIANLSDAILEVSPPSHQGPNFTFTRLYEISRSCVDEYDFNRGFCGIPVNP